MQVQDLEFDAEGRPWSSRYGDRYASRDGALGQAQHVFLAGSGLPRRWAGRRQFVIVETGFGLGTNFLATWAAWRADPQRPQRLHVVSLERHPLSAPDLARAAAATPADPLHALRRELLASWPLPLAGLHRCEFEHGRVVLTLALGDARQLMGRLALGADAFYLDGFAPDRNPEMWEPALVKALARRARTDASAASYTCARGVRDALAAEGFVVERAPGFGAKREMLQARFAPRWKTRRHEPPAAYGGPMRAVIVGAGLAGCACAYALRRRGWDVTLLERGATIAAGASGLPAGLLAPVLSADDNLASQLQRAGFLFSRQLLERLAPGGAAGAAAAAAIWAACGVFRQAEHAAAAADLRALIERSAWPAALVSYRSAAEATSLLGLAPRQGGAWFAGGAVVSGARWCEAMVDAARAHDGIGAAALRVDPAFAVERIERVDGGWELQGGNGRCHRAPIVVLANAMGVAPLAGLRHAPMQAVGGRVSLLQAPALQGLRAGLSGTGYAVPPLLGAAAVGATYEFEGSDDAIASTAPLEAARAPADADSGADADAHRHAHAANRRRLSELLEQDPDVAIDRAFAAQRCVARDRLPLAGAIADEAAALAAAPDLRGAHLADLPRQPGLYCLAALGSHGLALAPLLGELVASAINGEPLPVDTRLADAVDPGRFLLRHLR